MTKPAWIEKLNEAWVFAGLDYPNGRDEDAYKELKECVEEILASELQAVLGEEKEIKSAGSIIDEPRKAMQELVDLGYNAHREDCLKRMRERGIID